MSPSTLPTLTLQDAALLEDFLALSLDPNALAAKHNRPVAPLLDWAQSAAIAPYIDAYMSLFSRALQVRQIEALKKLSELSSTSPDPIEQRRAATTVVRVCQQILHPRAPRAPEPTRHAPESPPPPRASIREPVHDPAPPAAEQPRTPHTLVTPALTDVLMALRDPLTSFDPLVPPVPSVTSVPLVPALSPSPKRTAASRLITTAGLPHSRAP